MKPLHDCVALVTGASRRGGKGIALVLGERGATVYVTGRSVRGEPTTLGRPGTIDDTVEEVTARRGTGFAIRCDHTDDAQVEAAFDRIETEQGRLDLLVNNAWSGYEISPDPSLAFWELEWRHWDLMFDGGLRAAAFASALAAPAMVAVGRGLIVNITWVLDRPHGHAFYEVVKNATQAAECAARSRRNLLAPCRSSSPLSPRTTVHRRPATRCRDCRDPDTRTPSLRRPPHRRYST
jgi:NAD(P)-dependent dehydrogenase (short-subunit alcohol dehydrogenase family)